MGRAVDGCGRHEASGRWRRLVSVVLLCCSTLGCTSLGDDVQRAERAFHEARYEDVEVWLADLEPSLGKMEAPLRARYYYLAGMSALRIGKRNRARHALVLCREELGSTREPLPPEWMNNLRLALEEL